MHNVLDPFAVEKKYIKWKRISRVCYWNSKIAKTFSKTFIQATSPGEKEKSKEATQIQRTDEGNLHDTIPEQCLRASLWKILISSFAHKIDFAHNFSVDFF